MTNDTNTISGALQEVIDRLETNLQAKGVNASYNATTGILGLVDQINNISQSSGGGGGVPCYKVEFTGNSLNYSEWDFTTINGHCAILEIYLQYQYEPYQGNVTVSDGTNTYTVTTNAQGYGSLIAPITANSTTFTATYTNTSDTITVTKSTFLFVDKCNDSSMLSHYGTSIPLYIGSSSAGTPASEISFDSASTGYEVHSTNTNTSFYSMIPITDMEDTTDFVVDAEFKCKSKSNNEIGLYVANGDDQTQYGYGCLMYVYSPRYYNRRLTLTTSSTPKNQVIDTGILNETDYFKIHMEVNDTNIYSRLSKPNGDLIYEYTYTTTIANKQLGIIQKGGTTANTSNRVKNIKIRDVS